MIVSISTPTISITMLTRIRPEPVLCSTGSRGATSVDEPVSLRGAGVIGTAGRVAVPLAGRGETTGGALTDSIGRAKGTNISWPQ